MKISDKEQLAYLAGIVDGEGYIGIKKDKKKNSLNPIYYERLSVANTNRDMLYMFVKFFNCGSVKQHTFSKLSKKPYWIWEVASLKAINVIKQIYPYLVIKKKEAEILIALNIDKKKTKEKVFVKLLPEVVNYRELLYLNIKSLHGHL